MEQQIIYINKQGKEIEFSNSAPFKLTNVEGLSDNEITLNETSSSDQTGATCTSSKVQPKDITLNGEYEFDETLRRTLLSTILPGDKGILRLMDDHKDVYIEVSPSKTPVINDDAVIQEYQIVLRASYPYWRETKEETVFFNYYTPLFMFPRSFSNADQWKISERNLNIITNVFNSGDVSTGFTIKFIASSDVISPELLNIHTRDIIKMRKDFTLKTGDELTVCTMQGQKCVLLKRNGITSNAFKYLDISTTFWQLLPGDNVVRYGANNNQDGLSCTLSYETTYAGV